MNLKEGESRISRMSKIDENVSSVDEMRFKDLLKRFNISGFQKPLDLFIKSLKFDSLMPEYESKKEENLMIMLVIIEFQKMLDESLTTDDGVKNITMILTGSNVKQFTDAINKTGARIKKASHKYAFVLPKEELWLHKTGKILKSDILRNCFVTSDAFGQIADGKKKGDLVKPIMFKEQEVYYQSKQEALGKSKDSPEFFGWPDKKEIGECVYRIVFTNVTTRKMTAIYCKTDTTCSNIKNNTIMKKMNVKNQNLVAKMLIFKNIWRTMRVENFYKRKLKKFFGDQNIVQKLTQEDRKINDLLGEYMNAHFPNLYLSNTEPEGVFSFVNKTYLHADKRREESDSKQEILKADIIKRQFASLVNAEMFQKPDSAQISLNKKKLGLKSPFEELVQPIIIMEKQVIDHINMYNLDKKQGNITKPEMRQMFENFTANSKILLKFNRIILENVFNRSDVDSLGNGINEMIFDVEALVDKGTFSSKSISFVNQIHPTYLTLNFLNSFKIDYNSLKFIKIRIIDRSTKAVIIDQIVSLYENLDTLLFENILTKEIEFVYRNIPMKCLLCFNAIFIPKNLEMAHALLTPTLLNKNFQSFEQIVKRSDNYGDFYELFYNDVFVSQVKGNDFNLFSFSLQNCPIFSSALIKQQNMFLKSMRTDSLADFKAILKNLMNNDLNMRQLFLQTIDKMRKNGKIGESAGYDLVMRSIEMLSISERFFINQTNFNYLNSMFINLSPKLSTLGYNKPVLTRIYNYLKKYFEENSFIRFSDRVLIQSLAMETYLLLENNNILKMNFKINFLTEYIPIIANIALANSLYLERPKLVILIFNTILSTMYMKRYSDVNHVVYIDSLMTFFKVAIKTIAPENYAALRNLLVDFETLFMEYLVNSFAKILSPIYFSIYQDVKQTFLLICVLKSKEIQILKQLEKVELNFSSVFDVFFLMSIIANNIDFIRIHTTSRNFSSVFENLIVKECANLRTCVAKTLEYIDYASDRDFFLKKYMFHNDNLIEFKHSKAQSIKNILLNVKSLKIDSKVVEKIITEEVGKNLALNSKIQSLFQRQKDDRGKASLNNETSPPIDFNYINEDIYFEIFEDIEYDDSKDETEDHENMPKHINSLIFLNNLDYSLCNSLFYLHGPISDLNNIYEMTGEETSNLLTKYVSGSQILKSEIFQDVNNIGKTKNVSFLRLLVFLILSCTENEEIIKKHLVLLSKSLSKILFPDESDKVLSHILGFIIDEVYQFYPTFQFSLMIKNRVDSIDKDLFIGVRSATINLHEEIIDVTEICTKHYASNTFLHKRPSILFGRNFCQDLVLVLEDLRSKGILSNNLKRFELILEINRNGTVDFFNFAFIVEIKTKIAIVCKYTDTIFFNNKISENNLISDAVINRIFDDTSFLFLNNSVAYKLNLSFIGKSFVFELNKFDLSLNVTVTFAENCTSQLISNLIPWEFKTEDKQKKTKFEASEIAFDVEPYSFFLAIEDFIQYLIHKLLEQLSSNDFPRIVRMNTDSYDITSKTGKAIDPRNYFFELVEYERSLSKNQPMQLSVSFIEKV